MTPHVPVAPLTDVFGRRLRSLRVSVTDRCNLRCRYCMPEAEYVWLPREELLTFEEIRELVSAFTELGVDNVRLTGGDSGMAGRLRPTRHRRPVSSSAYDPF
jgi:GTP 3',8-cyclase